MSLQSMRSLLTKFVDSSTYLLDLDDVYMKHLKWVKCFPKIKPYYAVKANNDLILIKLLAYLGIGFDCASENEIKQILNTGVSANKIIYAHPCKQVSMIEYANKHGVNLMTFDSENELNKIKQYAPNAKVVLRMIAEDRDASYRLSIKYGADIKTCKKLIDKAIDLNIDLVGISFHMGYGNTKLNGYVDTIRNARLLFDYSVNKHNHQLRILDIGGGFPGLPTESELFDSIAKIVNESLDIYFPNNTENEVEIIAEPGRYYCVSAFTLCTKIIAKRVRENDDETKSFMYHINDGAYGAFNGRFNNNILAYIPVLNEENSTELFNSIIWGPTCCSYDFVNKDILLPELYEDDLLFWKNMGAYCNVSSTEFNGLNKPVTIVNHSVFWETIKDAFKDSCCLISIDRRYEKQKTGLL